MKQVVPIVNHADLPEPFARYWNSKDRLDRPEYEFYLIDGELYIDGDVEQRGLLHHWTLDGCAGIACFMMDEGLTPKRLPYITDYGLDVFEVVQSGDYEMSIRDRANGKTWVIYAG